MGTKPLLELLSPDELPPPHPEMERVVSITANTLSCLIISPLVIHYVGAKGCCQIAKSQISGECNQGKTLTVILH